MNVFYSRDEGVSSMQCACCDRPLEVKSTWKTASNRFYCSEFCADSEVSEAAPAPDPATLLQHHTNRPYERLERLLPYMRLYSGRASSDSGSPVTQA
jgi:hypothetical protein